MAPFERFARLGAPKAVWAVGSIRGALSQLVSVHDRLAERFEPGERLVYLGNYGGVGGDPVGCIDELLAFRRALIARPGMLADDVIYLRGQQEEMWQKLLQIQYAPNPRDILDWLVERGVGATVDAYGGTVAEGAAAARDGAMSLTRWTNGLRAQVRARPGHETLQTVLRRGALTDRAEGQGLLCVHAGLDPTRALDAQADRLWWHTAGFAALTAPYDGFARVVRGFDPDHAGLVATPHTISLDGGAGHGGTLIAARVLPTGEITDRIEA